MPKEAYPIRFEPNDWLGENDIIEPSWLEHIPERYYQVWAEVFKYLTIIEFYRNQLNSSIESEHSKAIQDRILEVTETYRTNDFLKHELKNWKIPPIVAEIYEKRENWQKANEYSKLAKRPIQDIDGKLYYEIAGLNADDQKRVLVFARLLVKPEPKLRRFVRKKLNQSKIEWRDIIRSQFDIRRREKQITELVPNTDFQRDELDWLTLPEFLMVIRDDTFGPLFNSYFPNQDRVTAYKENLRSPRNKIAHCIPLID